MVLEQLIKTRWIEKKPIYSFFFGTVFTIIAFFTASILFRTVPHFIGVATLFFIVVISLPSIRKLFESEEMIEVRGKKQPFLKEHESIIDFFIYFFIGIFVVLFVIALIKPGLVFSESFLYNIPEGNVKFIEGLPPPPPPNAKFAGIELSFLNPEMYTIFKNNIYVMIIAFILSLFYGSGALFLVTLNASIFASALASVVRMKLPIAFTWTFIPCNMGIMFLHMIPEVASYLMAAIAGGVLSKAFVKEKFLSKRFKLVLKDAVILLIASFIVLIVAAVIEVAISRELFTSNVCVNNKYIILSIIIIILLGIVVFELFRKKKKKKRKKMNKKAFELSINFIVTLILAIVILSAGIYFVRMVFTKSTELKQTLDQQTEMELERLMDSGEKVTIYPGKRTIDNGKMAVFGLGILNVIGETKEFKLTITPSTAVKKDGSEFIDKTNWINEAKITSHNTWIQTSAPLNGEQIKNNNKKKYLIGITPKETYAQSGATYVFDVEVKKPVEVEYKKNNNFEEYGSLKKIYVKVR